MKFYFLYLALIFSVVYSQTLPIIELRQNNSQGISVKEGQSVTIEGIVSVSNNFGNSGPAYIQDSTAGISIYGSQFANSVNIGDSVSVTSVVDNFNGLTQLNFTEGPSSFVILSSGSNIVPKVLTLNQIKSQFWNGIEKYEGLLVRVNNVSISGSGTFNGNTNYDIADQTGTLELRIDNDVTSVIGTAIPSEQVDIIGVIGQYDSSPPYNSGYQILLRSIEDLITDDNQPVILSPVYASDLTPTSFNVYFNTLREGNSEVRYGITEMLELGVVIDTTLVLEHIVELVDLNPLTRYYYKVYSTNQNGTSESNLQSVITPSDNPEVGKINVLFNYGVDNSIAIPGNEALGFIDFQQAVIERINSATYSIDLALYSFFGVNSIADAIVNAKNRGVKVRVVYDSREVQSSMQILLNNGIEMSQRPSSLSGIMHNKFAIFDARDTVLTNDWVWTGSWNWTSTELTWRNNVIEINDPAIASAYTKEFEEMWGSDNDIPNPSNAKFGSNKLNNTVHNFIVGNRNVELHFSPSDNTESQIVEAVNSADTSIYFNLLVFTSDPIYNAISSEFQSGVTDIRGIVDDVNASGSDFGLLQGFAEMFDYNLSGTSHHKYGIIDASFSSTNPIVITGSHNWSKSANERNDENTLIIEDIYIANKYLQEFKQRYNELGGTVSFVVPIITSIKEKGLYPSEIELYQNFPNPFNPITSLRFFIPKTDSVQLKVHDLLGREIKTIYKGVAPAGLNVFDFDASNLASGIYYYSLQVGEYFIAKKMMLIK